jgi:2'-5' RNA ligase
VRLFVALDLPDGARAALARWRDEVLSGRSDELRPVAAEALHLTLAFLGSRPETDVESIGRLALGEATAAPALELGEGAWLPPRRPRVLAVDLADPAGGLAALQARVSDALARGAGYEPERRPFRPHVTVARVRSGARVGDLSLPAVPRLGFDGLAVTLYRSRTASSGAIYEPLASATLS